MLAAAPADRRPGPTTRSAGRSVTSARTGAAGPRPGPTPAGCWNRRCRATCSAGAVTSAALRQRRRRPTRIVLVECAVAALRACERPARWIAKTPSASTDLFRCASLVSRGTRRTACRDVAGCRRASSFQLSCPSMSPVVTARPSWMTLLTFDDIATLERAWHGPADSGRESDVEGQSARRSP